MGVYIKGMEMPKDEPLIVKINPDGSVSTTWKNDYKKYEAIPVPPHGRLGDLDYLKLTFCSECTFYPDKCLEKTADGCDWHSIAHLEMCPTIIEAEGKDDV